MSKKCAVLSLLYRKTTKRPLRKTVQLHESKSTARSHTTPETFIAAEVAVLSSSRSSRSSGQKLSTSRSLDSHQKKSDVETHRSCRRLDYKLSPLKTRRGLAVKASFTKNVSPHKISPNTRSQSATGTASKCRSKYVAAAPRNATSTSTKSQKVDSNTADRRQATLWPCVGVPEEMKKDVTNSCLSSKNKSRLKRKGSSCVGVPEKMKKDDKYLAPKDSHSSKCPASQPTLTVKNSGTVRTKGPPCKGLVIFREMQKKKDYDDDRDFQSDSDSDYVPESAEDVSSDEGDVEPSDNDTVVGDDSGADTASVSNNWKPPVGHHKVFDRIDCDRDDICIPDEPVDCFRLFVDDEVMNLMVDETNLNAEQAMAKGERSQYARLNDWTNTSSDEMESFLALLLWMGLVKMPSINSYWQQSKLYRNFTALQTMARNRFQLGPTVEIVALCRQ